MHNRYGISDKGHVDKMYGILPYYTVGFILFVDIFNVVESAPEISVFEYGQLTEGAEPSFAQNAHIPALIQTYSVNVTPARPDLDKRFTYLKVEYISPMSTVVIKYNPDAATLDFYIRFPFNDIPYGIVGYSLKVQRRKRLSSWRKSKYKNNNRAIKISSKRIFDKKLSPSFF